MTDWDYAAGVTKGQHDERRRILQLIERLAIPAADKERMIIDRTELIRAIIKQVTNETQS